MAKNKVNFAEVKGFEAVEEGEYQVVIDKAEYREAQEEGKYDYINLTLKITEGENEGQNVWMIWSFSPKALWRMKDDLVALEVVGPDDELDFEYDEDADNALIEPEIVGLPAVAVVTQREYEGRTQNQVESLRLPDTKPAGKGKAKTAAGAGKGKTGGRKFK